MQILCMRHGHADGSGPGQGDAARPLSTHGRDEVRGVAEALRTGQVKPGRLVASPLLRAQQTAMLLAEELGIAGLIETEPSLAYTASAAAACAFLEDLEGPSVLAVGHMPTLPETIYLLSGTRLAGMVTAQVVCVQDGRATWSLEPGESAPRKL